MSATTPEHWAEPITAWARAMRGEGAAEATIHTRVTHLRVFARAHSDTPPTEIELGQLSEWLGRDGWKPNSRHAVRSSLRSFYDWMEYVGRRADNPGRRLRKVKRPAGEHRPAGELTVRSIQRHRDPRVALMAKLASILGMRAIEISRVHTDHIFEDLIGYSLHVHGKGDKWRTIPMPDDLAHELLDREPGWVFPNRSGGHLSNTYVTKLLSKAMPDGVTGHMLRHRAAGAFYTGTGYDLRATQEFLGHASVATTQIYTPADVSQLRRGMLAAAS